jgi:hypothetical protein
MISSTRADLMQYRDEASKIIERVAGDSERKVQLVEISMEREVQSGDREFAVAVSKRWVEESDWIVLIVGWNYGTISTEPAAGGKSVTEWEFRRAVELGKKAFAFLVGEPSTENEYRVSAEEKEDLKNWKDKQDEETRNKLKVFKESLASTHLEYFRNLRHFSQRLEKTLRAAIPDPASLPIGLLLAVRPSIQQCIDKVKLIAACKRVHDHLHELRQNAIRPILESALVQWRAEGQLGVSVGILIGLKVGFAEAKVQNISQEKQNLDVKGGNLLAALARVEEMAPEFDFQSQPTELDDFGRRVGRFSAAVQTAFTLTDQAMLKDSDALDDLYISFLTHLGAARQQRRLSHEEDAKLNDVLQTVEGNKRRLIGVLEAHHDWQYQHDKLDMLNGFRRSEDLGDQLANYLFNDSPQLRSMIEGETAELAQGDANPILASKLPLLSKNLGDLSSTRVLSMFDTMRKTFDDVFYQIDKRTFAAIEASEQRVRGLETRLEEMAQQQQPEAV